MDLADRIFFGTEERTAPEDLILGVHAARRICAACPVARQCLTAALVQGERYGVWGGASGKQLARMRERIEGGETIEHVVEAWFAAGRREPRR